MENKKICCPYCDGELEDGIFHATGANKLLWMPHTMKIPAFTFNLNKLVSQGAVTVDFKRVSSNTYTSAKYCRACDTLIMKTKLEK